MLHTFQAALIVKIIQKLHVVCFLNLGMGNQPGLLTSAKLIAVGFTGPFKKTRFSWPTRGLSTSDVRVRGSLAEVTVLTSKDQCDGGNSVIVGDGAHN